MTAAITLEMACAMELLEGALALLPGEKKLLSLMVARIRTPALLPPL